MAGLLGDDWNDPRTMATLALAGGLMGGRNLGQGLLGGVQAYQGLLGADQDRKTKKQITDAQMENYRSEIQQRQLQTAIAQQNQAREAAYFGNAGGGTGNQSQNGASSAPATSGAQPSMGMPAEGKFDQWSREYGIPKDALVVDYLKNGGKGISEMLMKRGAPDMQVTNGYAFDKNKLGAGFMPSLSTSTNGQTSMTRIGPDGMPVVSAPQGALSTFGAYKGMETGLGAAAKVNLRQNADGTTSPVSELTENPTLQRMLGGGQSQPGYATEPQMKASMAGGMGADAKAIQREIMSVKNDLMKPMDEGSKTMLRAHLADLQGQANDPRMGAQIAPSGAPAYGMTNQQAAQAKANEASLVGTATADVQATQARQAGKDGSLNAYRLVDQALAHPGLGTATGLSGTLDPRNYIPGTDAKNFDSLAQQLKGNAFLSAFAQLKGSGAITDVEGKKAESAIARLQQSQSEPEYRAALKDYQSVIGQGLKRMGVDPAQAGGATGGWDNGTPKPAPPQAMKGMQRGGYRFKGGDPSDQNSWEKM